MPKGIYKRTDYHKKLTRKIGLANKGRPAWCKGKKLPYPTWNKNKKMWDTRKHPMLGKKAPWAKKNPQVFKKGSIPWNKGKKRPEIIGEKHPRWKGGFPKCMDCGKESKSYGRKRCWSCYSKWLKKVRPIAWAKEKNPAWKDGKGREPYSLEFNEGLKDKIRKRDNYQCQNCNMIEEEHLVVYGINLNIHHIDYNKKNSNKNNLISLCRQCHTRTNFNRNYWKEYFNKSEVIKNGLLS